MYINHLAVSVDMFIPSCSALEENGYKRLVCNLAKQLLILFLTLHAHPNRCKTLSKLQCLGLDVLMIYTFPFPFPTTICVPMLIYYTLLVFITHIRWSYHISSLIVFSFICIWIGFPILWILTSSEQLSCL